MDHLHINNLWMNNLLQTFAGLGLEIAALSRGMAVIKEGQLVANSQLALVEARTLWHRAVQQSTDPALGATVGLQLNPRAAGVLVPIILHSPTVSTALEHIARFQTLISESGNYQSRELQYNQQLCIECGYIPVPSSVVINPHQVLSVITCTLWLLRVISNGKLSAECLYVPPELDAGAIAEALGCPVETRRGNLAFIVKAAHLGDEILGRDGHLYQLSLSYAEGLLRAKCAGQDFLNTIKGYVDVEQPVLVSIDRVAEQLGMHTRALQRNLTEQGSSFRQLKESVLKERTLDLLISQRLEVEDIAQQLGYSDASTFHRAFKAWFDVTPKKFRDQMGS